MANKYASFNEALLKDFGHNIKMNENFKGFVETPEYNIMKFSYDNFDTHRVLESQNFEFRTYNTKSGKKDIWSYVAKVTDEYDLELAKSKPMVIYRKLNKDSAEVFRQGIFKFVREKDNEVVFRKLKD